MTLKTTINDEGGFGPYGQKGEKGNQNPLHRRGVLVPFPRPPGFLGENQNRRLKQFWTQ